MTLDERAAGFRLLVSSWSRRQPEIWSAGSKRRVTAPKTAPNGSGSFPGSSPPKG